MNDAERKSQLQALQNWQLNRLEGHRARLPSTCGPRSVTVAAYHFWNADAFDSQFDYLENSIRETWSQCGLLKTVLVVNRITRRLEDFAAAASGWVKLDLCRELVPGDLYSMSVDCISRLCERFDTDYVLVVQNDGFPVRPGLEAFLGPYDYIGAPWVFGKDDRITRLLLKHRFDVGNGGFSLRSKWLCEQSAWHYRKKYRLIPYCYLITEDYFICKTLPSFERRYREKVRIASADVAATFSLEANVALYEEVGVCPFGIHGAPAFVRLLKDGKVPDGMAMEGGRHRVLKADTQVGGIQ